MILTPNDRNSICPRKLNGQHLYVGRCYKHKSRRASGNTANSDRSAVIRMDFVCANPKAHAELNILKLLPLLPLLCWIDPRCVVHLNEYKLRYATQLRNAHNILMRNVFENVSL